MKNREPKFSIAVHFIEDGIRSGKFSIGDRIPSVNAMKIRFGLSRSSVLLAMSELKSRGIIEAEPAVGYYVASDNIRTKHKILLLFNEFNAFKEDIYNSFIRSIGDQAQVDIMFHNFNFSVFETLLKNAAGKYTEYVVMPGKFTGIAPLLDSLGGKVVLVDHFADELKGRYSSVGQDFEEDTYNALERSLKSIQKYNNIVLIQSTQKEPEERYDGIVHFCQEFGFYPTHVKSIAGYTPHKGDLFITAEDREMVDLIKTASAKGMRPGVDFGIISYNDTPIKEVLCGGISTLSTDFSQMGRTLAELVLEDGIRTVANPCKLIIRMSI